jgi:pimeloyl-ACP methyl ester carboxylesterase
MSAAVPASNDATAVRPFRVEIPDADIADLKDRLARTRWAADTPGAGWSRGVPTAALRELAEHWATGFDWRAHEAALNAHPQFLTEIDGYDVHFLHVRSPRADATPLLLIHGWPGSVLEFRELIGQLTDPEAHGGDTVDAFHLVVPSLPGHGFGGPLTDEGWTHGRIAEAYISLMARLGYERYGVQGGDVGAFVAPEIARRAFERVIGVHVNALVTFPSGAPGELDDLTDDEQVRLARFENFRDDMMGYVHVQGTRPKTIAHALNDSPAGQLAWILEKFQEWTDPAAQRPEEAVDRDHLLADVSVYWFTGTAGSSANLYFETFHDPAMFAPDERSSVPTGVALSRTQDVTIRRLAERDHTIVHWTELDRGGHFLAMEAPDLLLADVRAFFAALRDSTGDRRRAR